MTKLSFRILTRNRKSAHLISQAADYQFEKKKLCVYVGVGNFSCRQKYYTYLRDHFFLFPSSRGVLNGDYARNQTNQLCHAISTPDREGVDYHTMVRTVIMAPERGFVPDRKKEIITEVKGRVCLFCAPPTLLRVATMAHLGKLDSGSVCIHH